MPVELEEYIRPGCTILTAFVAMPSFMWVKLLKDSLSHLHELVVPGKILFGKGPILVYLNNTIFHVRHTDKSGTSVVRIKMKGSVPRLHYVHPTCFEAGKPVEFIACGSNLWQSKIRFLVSFAGKYVPCEYMIEPKTSTGGSCNLDHELCKIFIPHLESNLWGPAFVEVENECGLSNFIPILIGDRETCSEMKLLQQVTFGSDSAQPNHLLPCEVSATKGEAFSEFMVDVAWLLKEPTSRKFSQAMSSIGIQRLHKILQILLLHESAAITEKILQKLEKMMMEAGPCQYTQVHGDHSLLFGAAKQSQDPAHDCDQRAPAADVVININNMNHGRCKPSGSNFLDRVTRPQSAAPVAVLFALCFVACALLFHTRCSISNLASSIRQCLADRIELL